jgi:hypothetical protein
MKRMMLLGMCLLAPFLACLAQEQQAPMTIATQRQMMAREVNIKIEPLSEEQIQAGLNADEIKDVIVKQLSDAGITVNESISQPTLVLRIRSLKVDYDIATFFQLSLQEESMLIRNRSIFNAMTWSQASLLSCRPEDLKKEVVDTVSDMAQTFAKDFIKATQNSSK